MGTQTCVYCIARVGNTPIVETRVGGRHYRQPHLCMYMYTYTLLYRYTYTNKVRPGVRKINAQGNSYILIQFCETSETKYSGKL